MQLKGWKATRHINLLRTSSSSGRDYFSTLSAVNGNGPGARFLNCCVVVNAPRNNLVTNWRQEGRHGPPMDQNNGVLLEVVAPYQECKRLPQCHNKTSTSKMECWLGFGVDAAQNTTSGCAEDGVLRLDWRSRGLHVRVLLIVGQDLPSIPIHRS